MQNALQNPHYKKIWEKVIMNRHPDADSLEKALTFEMTHKGSLIALENRENMIFSMENDCIEFDFKSPNFAKHITYYEVLEKAKYSNGDDETEIDACCYDCDSKNININDRLFKAEITKYTDAKVLGRPIILEDVLPLVQDKTDYYFRCGWFVNVYKDMGDIMEDAIFPWKLTKPLHEQTPETWEQIANLID